MHSKSQRYRIRLSKQITDNLSFEVNIALLFRSVPHTVKTKLNFSVYNGSKRKVNDGTVVTYFECRSRSNKIIVV